MTADNILVRAIILKVLVQILVFVNQEFVVRPLVQFIHYQEGCNL